VSYILPAIASLERHLKTFDSEPEKYRPDCCPHCGLAGVWSHGRYERKADRENGIFNPVPIPRYRCGKVRGCGRTCASLPSCIPPRRWYLWSAQQAVLALLLIGAPLHECARTLGRSRVTVRRWWHWLGNRHAHFWRHLRSLRPEWRLNYGLDFWERALETEPLRELMAVLNDKNIAVP
jgi:hypothetical protein